MFRRFGRTTVPAVLVLAAIGVAGCGGSSNQSSAYSNRSSAYSGSSGGGGGASVTPTQYAQQIATATVPLRSAINQIGNGSSAQDVTATAQCAAAAPGVVAAIGKLNPPSVDASLQTQLQSAVTNMGKACSALHDAIASHDPNAIKAATPTGEAAQNAFNSVIKQINANQ